jgi:ACS family hexuronate transporter-like MFS transporter
MLQNGMTESSPVLIKSRGFIGSRVYKVMENKNVLTTQPTASAVAPASGAKIGHYRWTICALLFFATTMNYVDRQILGLLAPTLEKSIGWNEIQYGYIVTAFQAAYAVGLLLMGRFMDWIGSRAGYAISIGIWSVSAAAHALARTPLGFGIARVALGVGEAGNFPAAIKTVAEWFPKKERALATGIFNSGTNLGATITPFLVRWIVNHFSWQAAFLSTGIFSAIPIFFWVRMYRRPQEHPRLGAAELQYIQSDPVEPTLKIAWLHLLPHRQTWAFVTGKFLTDPIWWFFLFWLPKFLNTKYGLSLTTMVWPLVIIYNAASVGSIFGGWLPAKLLKAGWTVNRARKSAMLMCALAVVPIMMAAKAQSLWAAVGLISLAVAAHQGWSANIFTLVSDTFPQRAVASVVGIGGFGGAVGGMFIATFAGWVLQVSGSYVPMFIIAGSVYLLALLVIHLLVPHLERADIDTGVTA